MRKISKRYKRKITLLRKKFRKAGFDLKNGVLLLKSMADSKHSSRLSRRHGSFKDWDSATATRIGIKVPLVTSHGKPLRSYSLVRRKIDIPDDKAFLWNEYESMKNSNK